MTDVTNAGSTEAFPLGRLSGNWNDDDGEVIDEYFEPSFNGPVSSESVAYEKEAVNAPTRILSRAVAVGLTGDGVTIADPVQVFPADLKRKRLIIQSSGDIAIGSEKSDVYNNALIKSPTQWSADNHTGALWVYAPSGAAVTVTVWSITE